MFVDLHILKSVKKHAVVVAPLIPYDNPKSYAENQLIPSGADVPVGLPGDRPVGPPKIITFFFLILLLNENTNCLVEALFCR